MRLYRMISSPNGRVNANAIFHHTLEHVRVCRNLRALLGGMA
jgi:hypothetical protein